MFAIVSVHYYPQCCEASLIELSNLARLSQPSHCILVNNNPAIHDRLVELSKRHAFIDAVELHDNSGLEFGAYQAGLDRTLAAGDFDWVLFANDTFATHQVFCSRHRDTLAWRVAQSSGDEVATVLGRIESLSRSYRIADARSHRWITTNLFALNRRALSLLHGRVHYPEIDGLIRAVSDAETFFSEDLDDALSSHLREWLFGETLGNRWRDAAPLTKGNAERFARKARAILQEKYLAALLEENRTAFVELKRSDIRSRLQCRAEQLVFDIRKSFDPHAQ